MSNCGVFPLPEDIVCEIFLRLPVKSIGKSRCVSNQWNSYLTSSRFIKAHLSRSQQNKLLIHTYHNDSLSTFTLRPDRVAEGNFEKLDWIPLLDEYRTTNFVGHCNGLVVIEIGRIGLLLMNPTTLEYFRLPELPNYKRCFGYGFGYDSSRDDYKVVILSHVYHDDDDDDDDDDDEDDDEDDDDDDDEEDDDGDPALCYAFADIYSVKMKSWRRVELAWPFIAGGAGVFVNGALHWMSRNPNNPILALDLGSEKLYVIPPLGSLLGELEYEDCILIASKGCIGIVCWDHSKRRNHIWTMNRYGMADSWTKNVYKVKRYGALTRPWRDALLVEYPYKLLFYSFSHEKPFTVTLETEIIKDSSDWGPRIDEALIFAESLVSPHRFHTQQQHGEEEEEDEQLCNVRLMLEKS